MAVAPDRRDLSVGDIIVPCGAPERPSWLRRDDREPFGTTGLVSTRPNRGLSLTPRTSTTQQPLRRQDRATGLTYVECPGLTLVALRDGGDFEPAVTFLLSRQRGPRDKGAIVLPFKARFRVDPVALRSLADQGVVVLRAEINDLEKAMISHAEDFIARSAEALRNIEAFMTSGRPTREEE